MILKNQIPDLIEPYQEYRIDQQICLDIMYHSGKIYGSYLATDKNNLDQNGPIVPLDGMFQKLPGIHLDNGISAFSQYQGQSSGGHTVFYACDSSEIPSSNLQEQIIALNEEDPVRKWQSAHKISLVGWSLRKAVSFDVTLEGLIAAFSFTYRLPTYGIFWHGAMTRDHSLLLDDRELQSVLGMSDDRGPEGIGILPRLSDVLLDDSVKEKVIDIGAGIRVATTRNGYYLSCLARKVNAGLVDLSLVVSSEGKVIGVKLERLAAAATRVLY